MEEPAYVLLIEDDVTMREIVTSYLRHFHHAVRAVADGTEALALFESGAKPSVVLSDVVMPGILGTTVADYLHASAGLRDIPIAFMTGSPELVPPGYRVFVKPMRLKEVLEFVEHAERT